MSTRASVGWVSRGRNPPGHARAADYEPLEPPPNSRATTRLPGRLRSGECAATREASAKAPEPAAVAADALWLASSSGKRRTAARLRSGAFMFNCSLERPIDHHL